MARKSLAEQIAERDWGVSWEESWGGCPQACRPGQNRRQIRRALPQSRENGGTSSGSPALAPNKPAAPSNTGTGSRKPPWRQNRRQGPFLTE